MNDKKCPLFINGCPYSSSLEESNTFISYLSQCKSFKDGCPFKDLDIINEIKSNIAGNEFSEDYKQEIIKKHINLSSSNWNELKTVCPAFSNGCIFNKSKKEDNILNISCPIWKNGCPFKTILSNKKISLIEALQSNSWDIIIKTSLNDDNKQSNDENNEKIFLAKILKEGTQQSHSLAESVQFVKKFRKKEITKELYQLLIRNLYFIYYTMESLLRNISKTSSNLNSLLFNELERVESLEKDLEFFYGSNWKEEIMQYSQDPTDDKNMSPATLNYVKRLRFCSQQSNAGELLIAHAYTRYLGDLSGGQLLKRMTRRSLDLPPAPRNATIHEIKKLPKEQVEGTEFYDFHDINDVNEFKISYRLKLDSLNINSSIADEMVNEANIAFRLNMELFQELDNIAGFVDESDHNINPHKGINMNTTPPEECPFSKMISGNSTVSKSIDNTTTVKLHTQENNKVKKDNYKLIIYITVLVIILAFLIKIMF